METLLSDDFLLSVWGPCEHFCGTLHISDDQVDYFRRVLDANRDVRWTFALMHSPAWWTASGFPQDPGNFTKRSRPTDRQPAGPA